MLLVAQVPGFLDLNGNDLFKMGFEQRKVIRFPRFAPGDECLRRSVALSRHQFRGYFGHFVEEPACHACATRIVAIILKAGYFRFGRF